MLEVTKKTHPDPIPQEKIEQAIRLMKTGHLFRYHFNAEICEETIPSDLEDKPATEVAMLEDEFSRYTGHKYVIAVNSCGSAIFLSLKAVGLQHNDKVLTSAFTFTAFSTQSYKLLNSGEDKILDIGCGTGLLGKELNSYHFENFYGIDISKKSLQFAATFNIYKDLSTAELGKKLDFADNSFDALVSCGVFTRQQVPLNSFEELIRILKPEGLFLLALRIEDNDFYYNELQKYYVEEVLGEVFQKVVNTTRCDKLANRIINSNVPDNALRSLAHPHYPHLIKQRSLHKSLPYWWGKVRMRGNSINTAHAFGHSPPSQPSPIKGEGVSKSKKFFGILTIKTIVFINFIFEE